MPSRGAAAVLNAVLWGSGYLYSRRGSSGVLAILAHLYLYFWLLSLGATNAVVALEVLGPPFLFGGLYFARDAYKNASPENIGPGLKTAMRSKVEQKKGVCTNCGAPVSSKAKFCSECGASQSEQGAS